VAGQERDTDDGAEELLRRALLDNDGSVAVAMALLLRLRILRPLPAGLPQALAPAA